LCDFPFDVLAPSLAREGKASIAVDWEDLSAFGFVALEDAEHTHEHGVHTISRVVDGRSRVLGLFYLPPYTRVVLDNLLESRPALAMEVFLSEGAHAVDYHYMTNAMRVAVWNALHEDNQDLAEGTTVEESGDLNHGHSWFDGPAGYSTWVGEAFMAAFVKAFAPSIPVTITLAHPTSDEAAHVIRHAVSPEPHEPPVPAPSSADVALAVAARRYLRRIVTVSYLRTALKAWLEAHPEI